jgi:glutamate synthase (ferredoxin)
MQPGCHTRRWVCGSQCVLAWDVCPQSASACLAGEINTLQGNLNWVASREHSLTHPAWDGREADFLPLTSPAASDSANLDMLAEFLVSVVCRSSSLPILHPASSSVQCASGLAHRMSTMQWCSPCQAVDVLIWALLQVKTGVPAEQALMTLVPEAYRNHPDLVKNYPEVHLAASAAPCRCWHD